MATVEQVAGTLASVVSGVANNQYTLTIEELNLSTRLSVLSLDGHEALNQPWRYEITFTCADKQIPINSVLSQSASLTFEVPNLVEQVVQISSLKKPTLPRTLYGVITEFSLLSVSKEEARYRIVLQPRLALFANDHFSAIYQNQSVVSVVEEVLRRHGFTGVDYRLELNDSYPAREFITQWQESDLEFIQRLLSDVGIWFRFESHSEHHCDVLVLSDYEQGLEDAGH
ncbi:MULTISPECIES: type VI secretion system tip protein VgrG [unclassified Gilliamella]|uniref:type VI secretion system tip protein VgrG n=1 Tax=unclassified Gilliamella TaxID=2685620 RepID=UPI00226980E6|nr:MULTISPECIES: type VI secretion system tip protein VgrG [unclassified Gilliamella]MCX8588474.1 type VI secretion system tip protein VgrG [Gilliamella sp. B3801]MCX8592811.1 type VI secretion system tip protein VgrG [Gilliamella sp. B3804]